MLSNFLNQFITVFFNLLGFAILARILLSWIPSVNNAGIKSFLFSVTEPVLGPFRSIIPRIGMVDISPIVAIIALDVVESMLLYLVSYIAL